MSVWEKAKARAEELFGRAERVYGQSHGDAAATAAGEAHEVEGEADLEADGHGGHRGHRGHRGHGEHRGHDRPGGTVGDRRPDDDGLAGQPAR